MLRSAMKGRLMTKLTMLLMAGALVAIALPGVAGADDAQSFALLACSEGSHSDNAPPYPPRVDSCQATSGAGQNVCADTACMAGTGIGVFTPLCTSCLDLLRAAGCKKKDVGFSCMGSVDRQKGVPGSNPDDIGIVCVKNFVFECKDDDDDDDDD